jgi:hypothetical protein
VGRVLRFLLYLLGTVTAGRPARRAAAWSPAGSPAESGAAGLTGDPRGAPGVLTAAADSRGGDAWPGRTRVLPRPGAADGEPGWPGTPPGRPGPAGPRGPRRWRLSPRLAWTAALLVVALIFRRAVAALVLAALSGALNLVGVSVHLPSVRFGWPWQSPAHTATANIELGPWVLQKIEGISRPALGQVNFNFLFTHRVSRNIGPWPCWYASTFYAVGHAAATVALNPGPAWWKPATGHYRLQVLSRPQAGRPGRVSVTMVLPAPQLPQSSHDVSIDNIQSKPVATQHSWTYPGFGCGLVLRPQFSPSVLYAQAQQLAFYRAGHLPQVTRPLIATAEREATQTIRGSFIQPTVNALGYRLDSFTLRWATAP